MVRGPLLAVQLAFVATVHTVRVEPLDHVPAQPGQVGGVVVPSLLQQQPFGRVPQPGVHGEPVHRRDHHLGLGPRDPTHRQLPARLGTVTTQRPSKPDHPAPGALHSPGRRSHEVLRRRPPIRTRGTGRIDRLDHRQLHAVQHRPEPLDRPHHLQLHLRRPQRPRDVIEIRDRVGHRGQRPDREVGRHRHPRLRIHQPARRHGVTLPVTTDSSDRWSGPFQNRCSTSEAARERVSTSSTTRWATGLDKLDHPVGDGPRQARPPGGVRPGCRCP